MKKNLLKIFTFLCLILPLLVVSYRSNAQITGTRNICVGSTNVPFTDVGSGIAHPWSASNTKITIDAGTGIVTGNSTGQCTIIYTLTSGLGTAGNGTDTFLVTIGTPPPAPAAITGNNTVCLVGSTLTLKDATMGGVWSVEDPTKVSFSTGDTTNTGGVESIVLHPAALGHTNVFFTVSSACGATNSEIGVTVIDKPAAPPAITGTTNVCNGFTTHLSNTVSGGVWSIASGTGSGTISTGGTVTGTAAGTATAKYTVSNSCGSNYITTPVTIESPLAAPASIGGYTGALCAGTTIALTDATVGGVWSTNNPSVANVDASGNLTANQQGAATISYTTSNSCGSIGTSLVVTVNSVQAVTPDGINGPSSMCDGGSIILLTDNTKGGTWVSSNTAVATVTKLDSNTVAVTSVAAGSTVISYTISNSGCGVAASSNFNLTVNSCGCTPPTPGAIKVNGGAALVYPASYTLNVGATAQLTDPTASTGTGYSGVWNTSNSSVAGVDSKGNVIGSGAGNTLISYTVTNTKCGATSVAVQLINVPVPPAAPDKCKGLAVSLSLATNDTIQCITTNSFAFNNGVTGGNPFYTNPAFIYNWDFNDGTKSTLASPVKKYGTPGEYDVTLTVTDSVGCQAGGVIQIKVGAVPTVGYTVAFQTSGGASTSFTSTSTIAAGTMSYSWNIVGSGTPPVTRTSTVPNPSLVLQPDTYKVTLTVNGSGGCSASYSQSVNTITGTATPVLSVAPITAFSGFTGTNTICYNGTPATAVYLANTTAGGNWYSSNPAVASIPQVPSPIAGGVSYGLITPVSAGSATIYYSVVSGSDSVRTSFDVTVLGNPATPVIYGSPTINNGSSVQFTANTPGGTWSVVDGTVLGIAALGNGENVTALKVGSTTVNYQVTNACSFTATGNYSVKVLPVCPALVNTAITASTNQVVEYHTLTLSKTGGNSGTWSSDNKLVATIDATSGVVTAVAIGSANITNYITDACGDTSRSYFTVTVVPAPPVTPPACTLGVSFTVNSPAQCITDNSFAFTETTTGGTAPITYTWDFKDGNTSTDLNPTHVYSHTGSYDVSLVVSDSKGCSANYMVQLAVGSVPTASFDVEFNTGTGTGTTFISTSSVASGSLSYHWDFDDGNTSTISNPTEYFPAAGTYKVKLVVTGSEGCSDFAEKFVPFGKTGLNPVTACPNPAVGSTVTLTMHTPTATTEIFAVILTPSGHVLSKQGPFTPSGNLVSIALDVTSLTSSGTYYVKLLDQNNHLIGVVAIRK